MKNKTKIIFYLLLPIWYWIIIVNMANYYFNEAIYYYQMGAMHYSYSDRVNGEKEGLKGDKYKKMGNNILKWLPKLVRPKGA